MAGCDMPVIINSGSGNQGIASTVPVIVYARENALMQEQLYRALVFSSLLTTYQKEFIGKLSAFCGAHHEKLAEFIREYNEAKGADVAWIDSTDWISPEPLHPLRDGHIAVSQHLIPILKEILS